MAELLLVGRGSPAAVDEELDPVVCGVGCRPAQGTEESRVEPGDTRKLVIEDRRTVGDDTVSLAKPSPVLATKDCAVSLARRTAVLATKNWGTAGFAGRAMVLTAKELGG